MKLIQFERKYDFGHEIAICLFRCRSHTLFQLSLDWNDYGGWPYLQISSGMGRAFCFILTIGKFGISFDIAGYTWPDFYDTEEHDLD